LLPTPFLDITNRVGSSANEQGLLGLAFAPNYAESGHFWVNFTDKQGDTVIARYTVTADPNVANPDSYYPVLQLQQPAPNHNGGMTAFGPDGMLWIGTGDGGASGDRFGNGQNPNSLLGKMLRLDVTSDPEGDYEIPADNPWVESDWNGQPVRNEIWAVGLRNPWRYSFDRDTGDLWIADVGQNVWEEVNLVPAGMAGGLNFGWPIMEGKNCYATQNCDQTGLHIPVTEYDHSGHCSITGGYAYRGAAYPQLSGVYFYGDYCSGRVWALYPDGSGGWQNPVAFESSLVLSSFAEDEAGELYLLDYTGSVNRLAVEEE
jgi:glucose/arabinose dehydrogenase